MPNTSSQGITIDVKAQVTGWEQSLKQFQNAFKNIDPGSSMGKKIGEMLNDLEGRIKGFSKNSEIKVFSDKQIDSTMAKISGVDKMIMDIANRFSNLKVGDFSLLSGGAEIKQLGIDLANLQSQLKGLQGMTLGNLFKDFPQMIELFKQLGVSLDTNNFKGIGDNITKEFGKASTEATNLQNALAAVDSSIADLQSRKAAKTEGPLGDLLDTGKYEAKMKELADLKMPEFKIDPNKMKQMGEQLLQNLDEALKTDKISDSLRAKGEAARAAIQEAFFPKDGIIDPTKLEANLKGIFDKFSSFDIGKLIRKGELFNNTAFAGQSGNTITGSAIYNWLGFKPEDVDKVKEEMTSKLNEFSSVISKQSSAQLGQMIKTGDVNGFKDTLKTALDEALKNTRNQVASIEGELKKLTEQREQIATRAAAASEKAGALQSGANTYNNVISDFQAKLSNLDKRISDIESKIGTAKGNLADTTKSGVEGEAGKAAARLNAAAEATKKYHSELGKVLSAEKALGSIQNLVTRWFSVYGAIRMARQAIKSMISDIKQLDSTINKISIVTNFSMDQLWAQIPQYTALAQKYGVAISGVYEVSQLYYQQGLKTAEVNELTASTLQLAKISGLDYSTATNYMTNAVRSFKMEMEDANSVTDAYAALAASSASSVQELATAMSKTASSAQAVGMTMEETSAMMAVMIEATREAPENIGSAMKSIISRYGEMTTDPSKLVDSEGQEMSLNKVDKALKTVGITLQDEEGQFRSFTDVITELAGKWDSLSANTQRYIATVMAGNRQQSRFLALVSSGERLQELTDVANNSEGTGQLQTLKTMDTIETKAQQAKTALQEIYNSQGLQDIIKGWYDFEAAIAKFYAKVAQLGKLNFASTLILQFTSLATAVTTIFGLIRTIVSTQWRTMQVSITGVEAEESAKRRTIKTDETNHAIAEDQRRLGSATSEQTSETAAAGLKSARGKALLRTGGMLVGAVASIIGNAMTASAAQMKEDTEKEREAKANKVETGGVLQGAGMGLSLGSTAGLFGMIAGTIIGGIAGLITSSANANDIRLETKTERVTRLKNDYEDKTNKALEAKNEVKSLESLKEQYDSLYKARNTSNEAMQQYYDLCNSIAESHAELIAGYDAEGNAVLNMGGAYDELYKAKRRASLKAQSEAAFAGYSYNSDPSVILANYIGDHQMDRNATGEAVLARADERYSNNDWRWGNAKQLFSFGLWGQFGALGDTIQARVQEQIVEALEEGETNGASILGAAIIEQGRLARYGQEGAYVTNYADTGVNENSTIYYDALREALGMDANAIITNEAVGAAFQKKYGSVNAKTAAQHISDVFKSYGFNDAFKWAEDYVAFLQGASRTAGQIQLAEIQEKQLKNAIHSSITSTFADNQDYSGIELAMYEDAIKEQLDTLMRETDADIQNAWGMIEDDIIDNGETYGIDALLKESPLAKLNKAQKKQATKLYNEVTQYTDEQFETIISQLDLTDEVVDYIRNHRNELIKDSKERFTELMTKDLTYESEDKSYTDRYGIEHRGKKAVLTEKEAATWTKEFGYDAYEGIGKQFENIVDGTAIPEYLKERTVDSIKALYNSVLESSLDDNQKREVTSLINSGNLQTIQGIRELAELLIQFGITLGDEGIGGALQEVLNITQTNVLAEVNTYLNTLGDTVKSLTDAMKKGFEGMDLKDAIEAATKMGVNLDDETFQFKNGKFFFKDTNTIIKAYTDGIYQWRDDLIKETKDSIKILDGITKNIDFNKQFTSKDGIQGTLTDIIRSNQKDISGTFTWRCVFQSLGLLDDMDLADSLNLKFKLWDTYTQHDQDFYSFIQDENAIWEAWISMKPGTERINVLRDITGLTIEEAEKVDDELSELEKTWDDLGKDQSKYGNNFIKYAIEQLKNKLQSLNTSDKAIDYFLASQMIIMDSIESWWDSNDILKEALKSEVFEKDIREKAIKALRNLDWKTIEDMKDDLGKGYDEIIKYGELFYQNYQNINKEAFSLMSKSISEGPQFIKITNANKTLLSKYGTNVVGERFEDEQGNIIKNIEDYEYAVLDFTGKDIQDLNKFLNDVLKIDGLTGKTKVDTVTAIQKAIGERSAKNVIGKIVSTYESFTYDVADSFAKLVGSTVEALEEMGLKYNTELGTYSIDPDKLLEIVKNKGINIDEQEIFGQLEQHRADLSFSSTANSIIKNASSVSADLLAKFADRVGMNFYTLVDKFDIGRNADGTYNIKLSKLRDLINLGILTVDEKIAEELNNSLTKLFDDIIGEITGLPNSMKSGFTKTSDMQKYVDMINQSDLFENIFTMFGENGLFVWSDSLQAYTYSMNGLVTQIEYFYRNLDYMTADQRTATKQLLDSNVRKLVNNIDIKGYLSSDRTDESWAAIGQAYDDYITYVSALNEARQERNVLLKERADAAEKAEAARKKAATKALQDTIENYRQQSISLQGENKRPTINKKEAVQQSQQAYQDVINQPLENFGTLLREVTEEAVEKLYTMPFGKDEIEQDIIIPEDTFKDLIDAGGKSAVTVVASIYESVSKKLTAEDAKAIYRSRAGQYVDNVSKSLNTTIGDIVDKQTADILAAGGYRFDPHLIKKGVYLITEIGTNLNAMYQAYYDGLKKTSSATLKELNDAQVNILNSSKNWGNNEQTAIDLLSKAAGVTYQELADFFTTMGWEFTEKTMNDLKAAGILESIGGNKVAIKDWRALAEIAGFDYGSPEYISGLSAYNDAIIKMNEATKDAIDDEISKLSSAQGGDLINLTYLTRKIIDSIEAANVAAWDAYYEEVALNMGDVMMPENIHGEDILNEKLVQYGAYIRDGMLHLLDGANIYKVIETIKNIGKDAFSSEQLAQLEDALNSIISNIIDLIKSGISGTLTNLDKVNLQKELSQLGIGDITLDFTETAEGLKLSTSSIIELYSRVKAIDAVAAQGMFGDVMSALQGSNKELETMTGILAKVNSLRAQIAELEKQGTTQEEAKLATLKQELGVYEQMAKYMQLSQPDSYKLFDSSRLNSGTQGLLNFYESISSMDQKLAQIAENGKNGQLTMSYSDFLIWAQDCSELAEATGKELNVAGYTFKKGADDFATLSAAAANHLIEVDGQLSVDLSGGLDLNLDFSDGKKNIASNEAVLKEYANQQVEMLDSMIEVLEVMVAMEKLNDLKADGDTHLELGELFEIGVTGEITKIRQETKDTATELMALANENTDLLNGLKNYTIEKNGASFSLYSMIEAMANENTEYLENMRKTLGDSTFEQLLNWITEKREVDVNNLDEFLAQLTKDYKETVTDDDTYITWIEGNVQRILSNSTLTSVDADKLTAMAKKEAERNEDDIEKIKKQIIAAAITPANELIETGEWEQLTYNLSLTPGANVKFNENTGIYTITIDGETFEWNPAKGEKVPLNFQKALAADMYLKGLVGKNGKLTWTGETSETEGEFIVETTVGKMNYSIKLEDNKGNVIYTDELGNTGKSLDELLDKRFKYLMQNGSGTTYEYLSSHGGSQTSWRFNKKAQIMMGIDEEYTAELTNTNINAAGGDALRKQITDILAEGYSEENLEEIKSILIPFDFKIKGEGVDAWNSISQALDFTTKDTLLNVIVHGIDDKTLEAVLNGTTATKPIELKYTTTVNDKECEVTKVTYGFDERNNPIEQREDGDWYNEKGDKVELAYTLDYTYYVNDDNEKEFLEIGRNNANGESVVVVDFKETTTSSLPTADKLQTLLNLRKDDGTIEFKISFNPQNADSYTPVSGEVGIDLEINDLKNDFDYVKEMMSEKGAQGKITITPIMAGEDGIKYREWIGEEKDGITYKVKMKVDDEGHFLDKEGHIINFEGEFKWEDHQKDWLGFEKIDKDGNIIAGVRYEEQPGENGSELTFYNQLKDNGVQTTIYYTVDTLLANGSQMTLDQVLEFLNGTDVSRAKMVLSLGMTDDEFNKLETVRNLMTLNNKKLDTTYKLTGIDELKEALNYVNLVKEAPDGELADGTIVTTYKTINENGEPVYSQWLEPKKDDKGQIIYRKIVYKAGVDPNDPSHEITEEDWASYEQYDENGNRIINIKYEIDGDEEVTSFDATVRNLEGKTITISYVFTAKTGKGPLSFSELMDYVNNPEQRQTLFDGWSEDLDSKEVENLREQLNELSALFDAVQEKTTQPLNISATIEPEATKLTRALDDLRIAIEKQNSESNGQDDEGSGQDNEEPGQEEDLGDSADDLGDSADDLGSSADDLSGAADELSGAAEKLIAVDPNASKYNIIKQNSDGTVSPIEGVYVTKDAEGRTIIVDNEGTIYSADESGIISYNNTDYTFKEDKTYTATRDGYTPINGILQERPETFVRDKYTVVLDNTATEPKMKADNYTVDSSKAPIWTSADSLVEKVPVGYLRLRGSREYKEAAYSLTSATEQSTIYIDTGTGQPYIEDEQGHFVPLTNYTYSDDNNTISWGKQPTEEDIRSAKSGTYGSEQEYYDAFFPKIFTMDLTESDKTFNSLDDTRFPTEREAFIKLFGQLQEAQEEISNQWESSYQMIVATLGRQEAIKFYNEQGLDYEELFNKIGQTKINNKSYTWEGTLDDLFKYILLDDPFKEGSSTELQDIGTAISVGMAQLKSMGLSPEIAEDYIYNIIKSYKGVISEDIVRFLSTTFMADFSTGESYLNPKNFNSIWKKNQQVEQQASLTPQQENYASELQQKRAIVDIGEGYFYEFTNKMEDQLGRVLKKVIPGDEGTTYDVKIGNDLYQYDDSYNSERNNEIGASIVQALMGATITSEPVEVELAVSPIGVTTNINIKVDVNGSAEGGGTANVTFSTTTSAHSTAVAKGGIALSGGRTLMGELGPEMVVSGGHYFIVGQNGAEFVNLDKDAIVFNHLQTKRLLNNGHGGHGRPVTNEHEATSFAKGNVSGPALASASSALSTLKALRDMWKNIAEKGLSEFAQQAGGGGGGGDGKNDAFIADLDRWYNLMREIDKLEKDITYQETLRSKLESDRVIDGKAYYESQKQSIKLLEDEIAKKHELVILQKQYYDARRKDLEASQFGEFITYDEHGHLQHTDAYYEKLADLMTQNGDSSAKYTAEEQYNMLVSWGFEDQMRYDTSGKEVDLKGGEGYATAVQAFWDKLQKWQDDIDELYDGFTEYQNDVLDLESKFNEELQKIIDNQVSLENRIEKAIEDARQREIDEAKSQKDAIQKSSEQFIQGLSDSLDKERKMYEDTQSQNELNRMRRQLAILQRSGGSASQIRSLQQDIASREQDEYFNEQQNQIDAIQKASDAEIKKLEQQISIMEDTLKYEKEHGLLWNEVKDIMTWTPEEIESFLLENSKDLEGKSTLQIAEDLRTIKSEIEQWIGYRDDENNPIASEGAHNWNSYYTAAQSAYSLDEKNDATIINAAKAAYNETYERTGDENAAARAADEIFYKQFGDRPGAHAVAENTSTGSSSKDSGSSSKDSGGSGSDSNKGTLDISCYCNGQSIGGQILIKPVGSYTPSYTEIINAVPNGYQYLSHTPKTVTISKNSEATIKVNCSIKLGSDKKVTGYVVSGVMNGDLITEKYANQSSDEARKKFRQKYPSGSITNIYAYKKGGLANYTGLAMVHGSPQDPEAFLNADETHMWRDKILSGNSGSLTSMLIDFQDMVSGMVNSDSYSEIGVSGSGVNIENAVVNMNATISNDYDARRAANTVMDEMIRIARKTTAQQARR